MRLPDFELEVFFGRHEFSAPRLLAQSDCEAMSIADLLALEPDPALAREDFLQTGLGYAENDGSPELRQAVAGLFEHMDGQDILLFSGAQEGIYACMNVLLEPGQHVISMFPAYQSLYEVARTLNCEVDFWPLRQTERGWALDMDQLAALIRPHTRAIVLNTPHNPTGYALNREEAKAVCALARKHGIWIFADEVYRGLDSRSALALGCLDQGRVAEKETAWDGASAPWLCDLYERGISLGVMSKAYGLAGLRIGWLACRDAVLRSALSRTKNYLSICCATPSEALALLALRHGPALLARSREIIRKNLRLADDFFARHSGLFVFNRPQAGPVGFHKIHIRQSVRDFCETMVSEAGILLLPGSVYGVDEAYFRMGFGRESFGENLAAFEVYLAEKKLI